MCLEQLSSEVILFFILYGITGVVPLIAAVDGYAFKGTLRGLDHAASEGKYILQGNNKWGIVDNEHSTVYIPPFRAYIESTAAGSNILDSTFDDDTTPITNIRTINIDGTEQWFDLNGRRIEKPTCPCILFR